MRYVELAAMRPHHCAVLPYVGNSAEEGYIDSGQVIQGFDPHVYVSIKAVKEMARMIGWSSTNGQALQLKAYEERIEGLEETNRDLQKRLDAVDVLVGPRI